MLWEPGSMPLLRVNLTRDGHRIAGRRPGDPAGMAVLRNRLSALPSGAPVIVMVHGYKFSPGRLAHTPHRHILAARPARHHRKAPSWPRHLGFCREDAAEGLCIAVGWEARGTIWHAYAEAGRAGAAFADLISAIRRHHPSPVNAICHSLGARVVLASLADLDPGDLGRAVLLAAAEFADRAAAAVATPAGRTVEIVNVASRENDIFDALLGLFLRPLSVSGSALGHGLPSAQPNWLDLTIDDERTRDRLLSLGLPLPPPSRRVCHWSGYLRPGMFALHRALLRDPDTLPLAVLRAALAQSRQKPTDAEATRTDCRRGPTGIALEA
jgi:hypothetical protein